MWSWLDWLWTFAEHITHDIWGWIEFLWRNIRRLADWALDAMRAIWYWVVWIAQRFWRVIKALRKINFKHLWHKIKRTYIRFQKALEWWRKHVQEPIDRMRRQVWQIYRTLFKPILTLLDSFRPIIRMIGLFNRKLAARLDHRLLDLEGKLMWPITASLRRLNSISSYFTAVFTTLGRLSRPVLLESMRRDALLVWEVLTNPRAVLYAPPERAGPPSIQSAQRDFREYLEHGTGPYAMGEAHARDMLRQGFEEGS